MNTANVRKWITALRGGEYKQTRRRLRDEHGYCCLGVACELYMKETGKGKWLDDITCRYSFAKHTDTEFATSASYLPPQVSDWLGITKDRQMDFAAINDHGGTFLDIANVLETSYLRAGEGEPIQ